MQIQNSIEITECNGQLFVDSRLVAQELGIAHKNFRATIEKYRTEIEQDFGQLPFETEVGYREQGGGNPEKFYYLNEDQATYLMTLSKNTVKVRACKRQLVKSFAEAKKLLQQQGPMFEWQKVTDNTLTSSRRCSHETARDSLASLLETFCFLAPAFWDLLPSGLTVAPQTDTASPAAKIFIEALTSRSW